METDYEKMFNNLNELLQDICKFLNTDKLRDLSPKDKKLAESLIGRCKVQLQEISKIEAPTNDEYVDMNSKTVSAVQEEETKSNVYSSVDDNVQVHATLIEEATVYPYKNLPAREASQEVKNGCISMRRKFLLGFEKTKKFYATIHKNWLLVYCNEKDMKPIMTFNLKNYEAKTENDRCTSFELMSTLVDKKVYSFMAITPKDMLQWVFKINRCHDNVIMQAKGLSVYENTNITNEDDVEERYDSVTTPRKYPSKDTENEDDEEENIYLELDVVSSIRNNNTPPSKKNPEKNNDIRPALPGRRPMRNLSIPVAPPTVKSLPLPQEESDDDGSIASYDDIKILNEPIKHQHSTSDQKQDTTDCSRDTFSDEDEDCAYEAFVVVQDAVKKIAPQEPQIKKSDIKPNDEDQKPVQGQQSAPPISPKAKTKPPLATKPALGARIASIKRQFKDF